jgi:hypothetical protein
MLRSEYLESIDGQLSQRFKRRIRTLYFEINQEPKSKNSITRQEKILFRNKILEELKVKKRKAYRGEVILQLDFFTTQNNPPAVHTLTKNYLDLLHKSMPDVDDISRLLFYDDSQIKILIANYHLNLYGHNQSGIRIKSTSLGNFINDIKLADRIIRNDFSDSDRRIHSEFEDKYYEQNSLHRYEDYHSELRELERTDHKNDPNYYHLQKHFLIRNIQEGYLKQNQIKINDLISIIESRYTTNIDSVTGSLGQLNELMEKMIFLSSDFLEFGEVPTREGETVIFKKKIRTLLEEFRLRYKRLFPLLHPINVTLVFIPPNNVSIDIDNLAMKIAPIVTEAFQPPSSLNFKYLDKYLDSRLYRETQIFQRFPEYSISGYQIIQIPRKSADPPNGKIKIVLTDGLNNFNNVWNMVNRVIKVWEDVQ